MADLTKTNGLFKFIEAASAEIAKDTAKISIATGQYIICDDGTAFYDNSLNQRIELTPDLATVLADYAKKTDLFAAITDLEFVIDETDTTLLEVHATKYDPSTGKSEILELGVVKAGDGLQWTPGENGEAPTLSVMPTWVKETAKAHVTVLANVTGDDVDAITAKITAPERDDIAICEHALGETGQTTRTAYVYDGTKWCAMDGAYDASNVYLKSDIKLAGSYTSVGNVSKGTAAATKDAGWTGKSMNEILTAIFSQELKLTSTPTPSVSMSLASTGAKEAGSTFTPKFTVTYDPKTYSYGSQANATAGSGTYAAPSDVTITTSTGTVTGAFSGKDGSAKTSIDITDTAFVVTTSTSYKGTKVTCAYANGSVPLTNIGNDDTTHQVKEGTATNTTATGTVTGYYPCYWGYKSASNKYTEFEFTAAELTALSKGSAMTTSIDTTDMLQLVFAAPAGKYTSIETKDANGLPAGTVVKANTVSMSFGTDGAGGTSNYDVWYIDNTKAYTGAMKISITAK